MQLLETFFQGIKRLTEQKRGRLFLLALILIVGVFLRTYQFREWLYFYPDQARDAIISEDAITGKTDWPLIGPIAASTRFKTGPIYYYFQIISGEIFGIGPDKMAYPDLLFGILAIPLFYIFLKRYFSPQLSLICTGLFAVSTYAIRYSRFAWNPNPIPFFVLLFLLALLAFLEYRERVSWWWAVALGTALGVGVQLHTVTLILFPAISVCVGGYLLWKSPRLWKQSVLILLVAVLLNTGQIRSELNNNFDNTRAFFNTSSGRAQAQTTGYGQVVLNNTLNFSETFAQIISSSGNPDQFNFPIVLERPHLSRDTYTPLGYNLFLAGIAVSLVFFLSGCWLLVRAFRRESDPRKREFLGLMILYSTMTFLIFIPINDDLRPRYFAPLIFLPFLFLGLWFQFVKEYFSRSAIYFGWGILLLLVMGNLYTITREAKAFIAMDRSGPQYVVLGEIEPMADFIGEQFAGQKNIYFFAQGKYIQNYFKPMNYVLRAKGMVLNRISNQKDVPSDMPVLSLTSAFVGAPSVSLPGFTVATCKNFGNLGWCRLDPETKQ
ncbi:MAG: glycosyltransferase family 39 protein [Candidatus Moraniibacteriota bacterium]